MGQSDDVYLGQLHPSTSVGLIISRGPRADKARKRGGGPLGSYKKVRSDKRPARRNGRQQYRKRRQVR